MENLLTTGVAARRLGVTPKTLQRWDRCGTFSRLAHRDRVTRFGYDWFEHIAHQRGCEMLVLNQERLSPEQEMVQDMMTIVHYFASRLVGLRNYRRRLDAALNKDIEHAAVAPHQA